MFCILVLLSDLCHRRLAGKEGTSVVDGPDPEAWHRVYRRVWSEGAEDQKV